ncbi:beta strand repeat-containing protein [Spirosoma taeanense]|nr:TMF family protein [Spirosoma taeanense]
MKNQYVLLLLLVGQTALAQTGPAINVPLSTYNLRANSEQRYRFQLPISSTLTKTVGIGSYKAFDDPAAPYNTYLGYSAGSGSSTYGNRNTVYIGSYAGAFGHRGGSNNVAVGAFAYYSQYAGVYNVMVGDSAGYNTGGGSANTFVGAGAGIQNTSGFNTFVGYRAGRLNTGGQDNTFVGASAGTQNTIGVNNTFIGSGAGASNTTGLNNVMLGYGAGSNNTAGVNSVFLGLQAGAGNTTGKQNQYMGVQAGFGNGTGSSNIAIGMRAGYNNKSASYNIMIGDSAGLNNLAWNNIMIGSKAGLANFNGTENTLIGIRAGTNTTAGSNTMLGFQAGLSNTTGQFNTFLGVQAGQNNTNGNSNVMIGTNAGYANTSGTANFFVGDNAGAGNTTGGYNVYLGTNAGNGTGVNGSNNLAIGFEAGRGNSGGTTNTFLGFRADAGASGLQNAAAIGANARVTVNNALVLGNNANVGIGTTAPSVRLHVTSGVANSSGLRLENLTSSSPAAGSASKFLTVDGTGTVILANYGSGGRVAADALWERNGQILHSRNADRVVIGQDIARMPADYNLFVSKGILTEKVKVAVKNTAEWSDYVFAPTYQLKPLAEVEEFIKTNQHLPGVPSAEGMVEQGNDLHQTDAMLLRKIEELTLYVIALEKRSQLQDQKNRRLTRQVAELRRQRR